MQVLSGATGVLEKLSPKILVEIGEVKFFRDREFFKRAPVTTTGCSGSKENAIRQVNRKRFPIDMRLRSGGTIFSVKNEFFAIEFSGGICKKFRFE